MTRQRESHIRRQITSLISPQLIRRRGRDLGVVQRQRKVDIVAFVYTLILGFATSRRRSLSGLRRAYTLATGTTLASSAFQDRFTPALAELMKQLTETAFQKLSRGSTRMCLALRAFTRVFLVDGSLIRLPDALEDDYPSVWTNHTKAGAKVHLVVCNYSIKHKSGGDPAVVIEQAPQTFTASHNAFPSVSVGRKRLDDAIVQSLVIPFLMKMNQILR